MHQFFINNQQQKSEKIFFWDISLEEKLYILSLAQIGIKKHQDCCEIVDFFSFISLFLFFGFILKNQVFLFVSLIKKISYLEAYLKSARFKDKRKGFPKNLFSLLKVGRRTAV